MESKVAAKWKRCEWRAKLPQNGRDVNGGQKVTTKWKRCEWRAKLPQNGRKHGNEWRREQMPQYGSNGIELKHGVGGVISGRLYMYKECASQTL